MMATGRIAAEHGSFNRIRQVVSWAKWHLDIGSAVFAGLTRVSSSSIIFFTYIHYVKSQPI